MKSSSQFQLKEFNSFNLESTSVQIYFPSDLDELRQVTEAIEQPYYVLGEGSNTLFTENVAPAIIKPKFKGILIEELETSYQIRVGAAENWSDLVRYTVNQGIFGLENLVLIPGSVGAAPVQNIGAYGVELADFCSGVQWYEFATNTLHLLDNKACEFAYRDSVFKRSKHNRGLISEVLLTLPKLWQPRLSYHGLNEFSDSVSAQQVMDKVVALRTAKLPDPKILPNAGSFFKNPVVTLQKYQELQHLFGELPSYPQADGLIKLAAAWLIDQAGLKGFQDKGVGIHKDQALVLVNYASRSGKDLVNLAKHVQREVFLMFDIHLQAEVRLVSGQGEIALDDPVLL